MNMKKTIQNIIRGLPRLSTKQINNEMERERFGYEQLNEENEVECTKCGKNKFRKWKCFGIQSVHLEYDYILLTELVQGLYSQLLC